MPVLIRHSSVSVYGSSMDGVGMRNACCDHYELYSVCKYSKLWNVFFYNESDSCSSYNGGFGSINSNAMRTCDNSMDPVKPNDNDNCWSVFE